MCYLLSGGLLWRLSRLHVRPHFHYDDGLDNVVDLFFTPPCYDIYTCATQEMIYATNGRTVLHSMVVHHIMAQMQLLAKNSMRYSTAQRDFIGDIILKLVNSSYLLEQYKLNLQSDEFKSHDSFSALAPDIAEGLALVDEARLECIIHSLPTNTFAVVEAGFRRKLNDVWEFYGAATAGRVSSYFITQDEDSLRQTTGLQGRVFASEDEVEVFAITLVLFALYLLILILETPHIGLCSFEVRAPRKKLFAINLLVLATHGLVLYALTMQGWRLQTALARTAGELGQMDVAIKDHLASRNVVNQLLAIQVSLMVLKSVLMPQFLNSSLTRLLQGIRRAAQKLWQVMVMVVLAILTMSSELLTLTGSNTEHALKPEQAFFSLLQGSKNQTTPASRIFLAFEMLIALLLVPFLLANITDSAQK